MWPLTLFPSLYLFTLSRCEAHYSLRDVVCSPQAHNWGRKFKWGKMCHCRECLTFSADLLLWEGRAQVLWTVWMDLKDFSILKSSYCENEAVHYLLFSISGMYLQHRWVMVIPDEPNAMRVRNCVKRAHWSQQRKVYVYVTWQVDFKWTSICFT